MPRRRRRKSNLDKEIIDFISAIFDAIITLWFMVFYSWYSLIKSIATRRPIKEITFKQQKEYKRRFAGVVLIIGLISFAAYATSGLILAPIFFLAFINVSIFLIQYLRARKKRKAITSNIDKHLRKALEVMDSTARWYSSEEEANRELVSCLKAQNIGAIYQYRLGNGRTADAKVGDVLIEGKLSPDTAEVDRLLGQLSGYTQHGNKVNVVIYGELNGNAKRRIENEIHNRYSGTVFLTYLNNPRRHRTGNPSFIT